MIYLTFRRVRPETAIRPRVEPVPRGHQTVQVFASRRIEAMLGKDVAQVFLVQNVKPHKAAIARAYALHCRLIEPAPAIGDCRPVGDHTGVRAPCGEFADNARAPVHNRAEYIEQQRLDFVSMGHEAYPFCPRWRK